MAVKLDMSKAYDRVEWEFIRAMMLKLGFADRWVHLIMQCVQTVSYSVLLNGAPAGFIKPTRGLRQGDPLSPYLFLICAEGLTSLFSQAEMTGSLQGLSICKGGPQISHLFFADDSLIFCRATIADCRALTYLLSCYERASGQKLNQEKTSLFFSTNTQHDIRQAICTELHTTSTGDLGKYLGLPPIIGKGRKQAFMDVKHKIANKLQDWKGKLFSQARKEILIKSVAQAIPVYSMSCFRMPDNLCKEINSMVGKFGGVNSQQRRKFIGKNGVIFVRKNKMGGWVLEIFQCLISLYLPSKDGDYYIILTRYFTVY